MEFLWIPISFPIFFLWIPLDSYGLPQSFLSVAMVFITYIYILDASAGLRPAYASEDPARIQPKSPEAWKTQWFCSLLTFQPPAKSGRKPSRNPTRNI